MGRLIHEIGTDHHEVTDSTGEQTQVVSSIFRTVRNTVNDSVGTNLVDDRPHQPEVVTIDGDESDSSRQPTWTITTRRCDDFVSVFG